MCIRDSDPCRALSCLEEICFEMSFTYVENACGTLFLVLSRGRTWDSATRDTSQPISQSVRRPNSGLAGMVKVGVDDPVNLLAAADRQTDGRTDKRTDATSDRQTTVEGPINRRRRRRAGHDWRRPSGRPIHVHPDRPSTTTEATACGRGRCGSCAAVR